jgi:hypothetical protein
MRLPFGLDFISVLVGVALAMWVLPWILGMFAKRSAPAAAK